MTGPALKAGIQRGDVILAVNDTKVERVVDLNKLVGKLARESSVALLVLRGDSVVYVPVN